MNDFVTVAMVSCCTTIITSLRDDAINIYRRNFAVVLSDIELGGSRTDHSPHMLLHVTNSTRMLVTSRYETALTSVTGVIAGRIELRHTKRNRCSGGTPKPSLAFPQIK